jgi:hypothetical protein
MIKLDKSLHAWGTPKFQAVLKQEIEQLGADNLPLQQGLSTGNYVSDTPFTVLVHSVAEMDNMIRVKVGIFYQGIIGGCSCTDDPTPASDINEYCEVHLDIDKASAITTVVPVCE